MYLHENLDVFQSLIINASEYTGKDIIIVEKDYYITLILRMLSETHENCVFKGGTSLSKGYQIIDRFSEDVDITFDEHIGKKRRKKLKHETMKAISDNLNLPTENFNETESNRDLNSYHFRYHSVFDEDASSLLDTIPEYVKVETSLGSYAFPTETRQIESYIGKQAATITFSKMQTDVPGIYMIFTSLRHLLRLMPIFTVCLNKFDLTDIK